MSKNAERLNTNMKYLTICEKNLRNYIVCTG